MNFSCRTLLIAFSVALAFLPSAIGGQPLSVTDGSGTPVRIVTDANPIDTPPHEGAGEPRPGFSRVKPLTGGRSEQDAATVAPVTAWPMFQADARHTGYVPISMDPGLFSLRWQKNLGPNIPLNPVAAGDGMVFVSLETYFDEQAGLHALRAIDGQELWTKTFGSVFSVNPPSYAYGKVYLQTGNHASDTWLWAFEGATGELVFQSPHAAQWERYYAPTVYDGTVYVDGGYYGGMYAFDATTGDQEWFHGLPQYDQWTPAVAGSTAYAYVGDYQPGLYGLDRATGEEVLFIPDPDFDWNGWSMDLAPVIGDHDDVIAIHDGRLISFDTALGTIRWQVASQFLGQPAVAGGRIYAIDGNRLEVIDELTHAELWWWEPSDGTLSDPFIVTDSHILVSSSTTTYAVDLATGLTAWSYPVSGTLALADGTLYVASSGGVLTAINAPHVVPVAMTFTDSGGNGILEPGETADVVTTWRAGAIGVTGVTGTAESAGDFSVIDGDASYGDIAAGATVGCDSEADCYAVAITGTRPQTHWDVDLFETLNTGDRHAWRLHIGDSFADVPSTSPFYRFVETLLHNQVTAGCGGGLFCPTGPTLREQVAVFDLLAAEGPGYSPPPCGGTPMFADVPIPYPYCRWIEELARRGVTAGCGGGNFCPQEPVTREQMAPLVLRAVDPSLNPPECTTPMFSDVPATSPFCRWIEEMARRGITAGCGGGMFCPSGLATREQMAVFLVRAFGLTL